MTERHRQRLTVLQRQVLAAPTAGGLISDLKSFAFGKLEESALHPGDRIAQVLKAHGVQFVFCLSGGHISPILVGAEDAGIKVVDVRDEKNAVFAADAVARLSGVPGVAAVTAGPGITNTVTAVKNAQMAQSPVVLLGGAAPLIYQGKGALQDIDQRAILEPIVKRCWTVRVVRDIVPALREAFREAVSGVPGPVFVELPLDILYSYLFLGAQFGIFDMYKSSQVPAEIKAEVIVPTENAPMTRDAYLSSRKPDELVFTKAKNGVKGLSSLGGAAVFRHRFAGARDEVDVSPLPVDIPLSPQRDLEATAKLIAGAKRPVLVLGSQSTVRAEKVPTMVDAVAKLGMPTFLGGMARGLLGRDHPCFVRQNRGAALKNSDLVILVGSVVDFRLNYGSALPKNTKIVAVNRDASHLALNQGALAALSGGGWTATIASLGCPSDFLIRLAALAPGQGRFDSWCGGLKSEEAQKEQVNRAKSSELAVGRGDKANQELLNPINLLHQLEDVLPDNAILVADGGDFVATASYIVRPRGPLQWLDPGAFGTLGVGGGFALGAKLARPEAEVWLLWGDGSCGYSVSEFETFNRFKLPVIALVGNDACWGQIERDQTSWFGSPVACNLDYTQYEEVAKGYGGSGLTITQPSEDATAVLREAQRQARDGTKPILINALIGRTDFREGSISA